MSFTYDSTTLAHYGVLGMKWGVRKDPSRAYQKASKKLSKLNEAALKSKESSIGATGKSIKVHKKVMKLERKRAKEEKRIADAKNGARQMNHWIDQLEKINKTDGEAYQTYSKMRDKANAAADKHQKKYDKADKQYAKAKAKSDRILLNAKKRDLKSAKASYKAEKWTSQMLNTFGETSMEELRKKYA